MKLQIESKIFIVLTTTIVIAVFHLAVSTSQMVGHMIHRELFFIPIVLSCFWFGLKPGLISTIIISAIYASKAIIGSGTGLLLVPTLFQIFTFLLVAIILGSLADHNEKFHEDNIRKKELAALGNAALNLGTEIQDVLTALKKAYIQIKNDSPGKDEIEEGFNRLDNLVTILTSFVEKDHRQKINFNINSLIEDQILKFKEKIDAADISIVTQLDDKGCPSKVFEKSIIKLISDLLNNAIEASPNGGKIWIETSHRPTYNVLEIKDEGTGIKPEHLKKIFRPFFTTKQGSHGLSLASNYKFIQSCGGNMNVSSIIGKGACFKVKIPIDQSSNPINYMNKISDWNPDKDE
ncbi:MAG: ATP-binding protein [Desulfobacula sp.]|nr:ATP-binding protein [Desulfobacula sp.]